MRSSWERGSMRVLVAIIALHAVNAVAQTNSTTNPPPPILPPSAPPRISINYNNVLDSMADRLRAAGEYQEALASSYETTMRANLIREAVYSEILQNRIRRLATRHALREMHFQEKERALDRALEHDQLKVERKLERLEDIPKSVAHFQGSNSLNDMLEAIIHLGAEEALMKTEPIPLNSQLRADLRVMQGVGDSRTAVDLTDDGDAFDWNLPLRLQTPELMPLIEQYREARQKLVEAAEAGREPSADEFNAASDALDKLFEKIVALKPETITSNRDKAYIVFKEGRKFVTEQSRQLGFFATGQAIRSPFKGDTVQALISYMSAYGFRFAPPRSGGENSYKAVFDSMHDVLVKLRESN
jgi:hypothetical protein